MGSLKKLLIIGFFLAGCGPESELPGATSLATGTANELSVEPITFSFADFADATPFQLNGTTIVSGNSFRLTDTLINQAGSAYTRTALALQSDHSFSAYFRMRITDAAGATFPGDGVMFVVQAGAPTHVGNLATGGDLAYDGTPQSLGVEFDTHLNASLADVDNNHVGTHLNGDMSQHLAAVPSSTPWVDGSTYSVWVDYDGTQSLLEVRTAESSQVRPATALLSQTIDLTPALGTLPVRAGFTGSTGQSWAHDWIDAFDFQDHYAPLDPANHLYASGPRSLSFTASPATGAHQSVLTVTVLDALGDRVPGWPVQVTTDQGQLRVASGVTDANGTLTATLTAGLSAATATAQALVAQGPTGSVQIQLLANPGISVSASGPGRVAPADAVVLVPYGNGQAFSFTPAPGNHVEEVRVDGVSAGRTATLQFDDVRVSHRLEVVFAQNDYRVGFNCASASGSACLAALGWVGMRRRRDRKLRVMSRR